MGFLVVFFFFLYISCNRTFYPLAVKNNFDNKYTYFYILHDESRKNIIRAIRYIFSDPLWTYYYYYILPLVFFFLFDISTNNLLDPCMCAWRIGKPDPNNVTGSCRNIVLFEYHTVYFYYYYYDCNFLSLVY